MQLWKNTCKHGRYLIGRMILPIVIFCASGAHAEDLTASITLCSATVNDFNHQFANIKSLDTKGNIPESSGLIVHTIHGAGKGPAELNLAQLNALTVDANKTCGDFMNATPPVFLPWCGSNKNAQTKKFSDASSWSYIRLDTLNNSTAQQPTNDVVCESSNNKRYGLIFSNAYMNENNNLGCMYPLDGDTGNRTHMGCGISQNSGIPPHIIQQEGQGSCPVTDDSNTYITDFNQLLKYNYGGKSYASVAGSLICSLPKSKFDVWVDVRKKIDLADTTWPVNEFVLWNWETYSTADLAKNNFITGIYYLSGCAVASDGTRAEAQAIADLYKKWSGVDLPVINLSNSELHKKSATPFSCN